MCGEYTRKTGLKPTIHEATFVTGDTATLLFVRAAHEISNTTCTFYKLLENRQLALCMVGFTDAHNFKKLMMKI